MHQPEPLFQAFDAGWVFFGLAILAISVWLLIDIRRTGIPVHDDDDEWGVDLPSESPEADARKRTF